MKPKIPTTKPNWSKGRYAVLVGDEHQGYFRRIDSALRWRDYLAASAAKGTTIYITDNGATVNVKRVGDDVTRFW